MLLKTPADCAATLHSLASSISPAVGEWGGSLPWAWLLISCFGLRVNHVHGDLASLFRFNFTYVVQMDMHLPIQEVDAAASHHACSAITQGSSGSCQRTHDMLDGSPRGLGCQDQFPIAAALRFMLHAAVHRHCQNIHRCCSIGTHQRPPLQCSADARKAVFAVQVKDRLLYEAFAGSNVGCSDARVMWDHSTGRSKGYGFVSFRSQEEAEAAITKMNGKAVPQQSICSQLHTIRTQLPNPSRSLLLRSH